MRTTTLLALASILALGIACDAKVAPPIEPSGTGGTPTTPCDDLDADGVCDTQETQCAGDPQSGDDDGDGQCNNLDPDDDGDGCQDDIDAAPLVASGDTDGDSVADDCDPCPQDSPNDSDLDTVCDSDDQCEGGDDRQDADGDLTPDHCDLCPADALGDSDGDGTCDSDDACPGYDDAIDRDFDGEPDDCDLCPDDNPSDSDGDGVCESVDICPGGNDTLDTDGDGAPDFCDPCPVNNPNDTDGDGICDNFDLCPGYVDGAFDADGDGFDDTEGDCDDCNPIAGPGSFDVPGSGFDEDCDGVIDNRELCDSGYPLTDLDPVHAAHALEICTTVAADGYGLNTASWVRASGAAAAAGTNVGLLSDFGNISLIEGSRMLGLSSGRARDLTDPNACGTDSCTTFGAGSAPAGFPQNVPGCSGGTNINDDIALQLNLVAPMNAEGFILRFYFMSFEFPEWVCTTYNDQFIIKMDPAPTGAINGNIAFDSQSNPVSVNMGFMDVCNPASAVEWTAFCTVGCPSLPSPYCSLGDSELGGTGFNTWQAYSGGTGWLEVTAPVNPGASFTLRMAVWDTGDTALDSSVLLDSFEWVATPVDVGVQPQ